MQNVCKMYVNIMQKNCKNYAKSTQKIMQKGYSHALHTHIYIEYARHGENTGLLFGTFSTWHLALGTFGTWHFWHLAFGNWQLGLLALGNFGTCHFWHLAFLALLALLASQPFLSDLLFAKWHLALLALATFGTFGTFG